MRFDDRLSTILKGNYDSPRARTLRWQQLTDVIAQAGPTLPEPVAARALRLVAVLGREIPPPMLQMQAAAIAGQCHYAPLIVWFAAQGAAAAEAVMSVVKLSEDDWLGALPQLGPLSRSLLRQRTDLGPRVAQGLQLFAASDMTLSYQRDAEPKAANDSAEIRDLVRRIEEYRQRQPVREHLSMPTDVGGKADRIQFVTDAAARIIDAETRGRGRFVGIDLAQPAAAFETGCDAGTARIVGKRGRIEAGRLLLQGDDYWSGTWLCEAEPRFAAETGLFLGYAGSLRRPERHEVIAFAEPAPADQPRGDYQPQLLRQLMHELRSPLNAIGGFAQLIEGQYAGPVATAYISAARTILFETAKLGEVIDEIDLLAQMSSEGGDNQQNGTNVGAVLRAMRDDLRNGRHASDLHVTMDEDDRALTEAAAPPDLMRMLKLWLQPLASQVVGPLGLQVHREDGRLQISADHAMSDDADNSASLGFAFAAAADLARRSGGSLAVEGDQHILNIPLLQQEPASGEKVG